MSRLPRTTAAVLAAAALAPATALADGNELRGQPQIFRVNATTVNVEFTTDDKVSTSRTRVEVSGRGTARSVKADGRHGSDYRYVARIKLRKAVEVGRKYTVKFRLDGGDVVKRLVIVKTAA